MRLDAIISLDWIEFVSALVSRVSLDTSVVLRNPRGISRLITGGSTLNLTSAFQTHPDAVDPHAPRPVLHQVEGYAGDRIGLSQIDAV